MKLTLINPPPFRKVEKWDIPDYPQVGTGYLASSLRKAKITDFTIIDAKLERLNIKDVLKRVKDLSPNIVGLSAMTHEIGQAAIIANEIKKSLPICKIIIGGVHLSAIPEDTMKSFKVFDLGLIGEAEKTLPNLMDCLSNEGNLSKICGLIHWDNGNLIKNLPASVPEELDSIPFPAWDLFPKAKEYPLLYTRGCPFKCNFCMRFHGDKVRSRSPENLVEEMEKIVLDYSPKEFWFIDETFGLYKKNVFALMDLIQKKKLHSKTKWWAATRVSVATFELLDKMKESGCYKVGFGIESGNETILKNSKKNMSIKKSISLIDYCKKIGMLTEAYFIIGHPCETRKTIKDTINLSVRLNADITAFGIMVPYPKTEIFDMVQKGEGNYKLISTNWGDYNKQIGGAIELKNITRSELEFWQIWAYLKVFISNRRYKELVVTMLKFRKAAYTLVKKQVKSFLKLNAQVSR
tara:strand:- start:220 stop:1611 length:1392 start_codon:yes stop_codon:yes gene_type:complete